MSYGDGEGRRAAGWGRGRERGREGGRERGREGEREYARERIRKDAADAERRARHGRIALAPIKEGPASSTAMPAALHPALGAGPPALGRRSVSKKYCKDFMKALV